MPQYINMHEHFPGRPSGPAFYISTVNNVANHGPASQGSATEADACFGKIQQQSIEVRVCCWSWLVFCTRHTRSILLVYGVVLRV